MALLGASLPVLFHLLQLQTQQFWLGTAGAACLVAKFLIEGVAALVQGQNDIFAFGIIIVVACQTS